MLSHIAEIVRNAKRCNYRHLVVLSGNREWGLENLRKIIDSGDYERRIVFTWKPDFTVDAEIEELKNSEKYLGTTYDFLAMDFHHSFVPNDLGKLVSIVRGGGLIVMIVPPLEEWKKSVNFFHESILTPPYSMEDIRHNFIPWVIRKLQEHDGISIYTPEGWIKKSTVRCVPESKKVDDSSLPEKLKGLCITQDQVDVLLKGGDIASGDILVLTADRGRGKSSVLGILTAYLIKERKLRSIGVTAPDAKNLDEFYRFLSITLNRLGIKHTRRGREVRGKKFRVEYREPANVSPRKYDLLVVDEAAGIPVPLLLEMARAKRVIYSTTVHGYEGTGRSFAIRFMREVKKTGKRIITMEMKTPIRYGENDPVERWLFDTLLLDSEPADIDMVELDKLEYRKYRIEDLLKDERKLREYYGIFVLAHYRNNPNDLGILCDAPNQEIRTLEYKGHVVCSVQLAREGKIEEFAEDMYFGEVPPGNIVPDVVIKHYKDRDFSRLSGLRIVRIATHPSFMNMGIGSRMLDLLAKENADWIGSSFGATPELLRFWLRKGFNVLHISPKMNSKTGEYSVVVLKSISEEARASERIIRKNFASRFILTLGDVHSNLDPEIARVILKTAPRRGKVKLSDLDWRRIASYAWGPGNYEVTMDAIYRVASQYFLSRKTPHLNEEQERILIARVLQHRHWEEVGHLIGKGGTYVVIELREIMRKFIPYEYEDEVLEFQRRYHGMDSGDENEIS